MIWAKQGEGKPQPETHRPPALTASAHGYLKKLLSLFSRIFSKLFSERSNLFHTMFDVFCLFPIGYKHICLYMCERERETHISVFLPQTALSLCYEQKCLCATHPHPHAVATSSEFLLNVCARAWPHGMQILPSGVSNRFRQLHDDTFAAVVHRRYRHWSRRW